MFDRIAGRYDLMNSVMSAGLHHRWRARAVELRAVAPGRPRARRLLRHGRPRARAEAPGRPGGRGGRARLLRADARAGAREVAPARRSTVDYRAGQRARAAVRGRRASTPRPSASGSATWSTSPRALAEMRRVVRPGGRVVVLEITTPERPPLSWFYSLWFDRIVPLLGRGRGRAATPTPTCPNRSGASRRRAGWRELMDDGGLRDVRYLLLAGGIVAIHAGTRRGRAQRPRRAGRGARRGFASRRCSTPTAARMRALVERAERELHEARPGTARRSRRRARTRSPRAASGCGRCSSSSAAAARTDGEPLRARGRGGRAGAHGDARPRRRARRGAAAARPADRVRERGPRRRPPRPATSSSRAPSRCWRGNGSAGAGPGAVRRLRGARARRAGAARGRLRRRRRRSSATCGAAS